LCFEKLGELARGRVVLLSPKIEKPMSISEGCPLFFVFVCPNIREQWECRRFIYTQSACRGYEINLVIAYYYYYYTTCRQKRRRQIRVGVAVIRLVIDYGRRRRRRRRRRRAVLYNSI